MALNKIYIAAGGFSVLLALNIYMQVPWFAKRSKQLAQIRVEDVFETILKDFESEESVEKRIQMLQSIKEELQDVDDLGLLDDLKAQRYLDCINHMNQRIYGKIWKEKLEVKANG